MDKILSDRIDPIINSINTVINPDIQELKNLLQSVNDNMINLSDTLKLLLQENINNKIEEHESNLKKKQLHVCFVKLIDGRVATVPFNNIKTINDIIDYLKKYYFIGLTLGRHTLLYNNQVLEPIRSLADYNIEHESVLHLVTTMFGGYNKKKSYHRKTGNNKRSKKNK